AQKGFRLAHRAAVGVHPSDERFLHHILRIGDRTQHAIGNADQFRAQRIEAFGCIALRGYVDHHAAAFATTCLVCWSNQRSKPTARRCHPWMMWITSVRFTCSSSVKGAGMVLRASSRSWPCDRRVSPSNHPSAERSRSKEHSASRQSDGN